MLRTIILLCSVSVDPSACTRRTAIDFYPLPAPTVICGTGDAMGAATQLRAKPGESYIVTRCERVREAAR